MGVETTRYQARGVGGWILMAVMVVCLAAVGCGKSGSGGGGGGGTDTPLSASNPPAGLNTSQSTMLDGTGVAGPVRARLLNVRPAPGSQVVSNPSASCATKTAPFPCFELNAEICMDAVSNPTNSPLLTSMRLRAVLSADGVTPIFSAGMPFEVGPQSANSVTPGTCTSMVTNVSMKPGFPSPAEGTPTYLILVATYGNAFVANINAGACPSPESIASNNLAAAPQCAFRQAFNLGYHF